MRASTALAIFLTALALTLLASLLLPALPPSKRHPTRIGCVNCLTAKIVIYPKPIAPAVPNRPITP